MILDKKQFNITYFKQWLKVNFSSFEGLLITDKVYLNFNIELSANDKNKIIDFYDNISDKDFDLNSIRLRIYNLVETTTNYKFINYKTGLRIRLKPIITNKYYGEVREIIYYENININNEQQEGIKPVVKEKFIYYRNELGFVYKRDLIISWFHEDGSISNDTKVMTKYYNKTESLNEIKRFRNNIIEFMQVPLLDILKDKLTDKTYLEIITLSRNLMNKLNSYISNYVQWGNLTLIDKLKEDTTDWLDIDINNITIRDFIINKLSYMDNF